MKSVSKNRCFLCFRPVVDVENMTVQNAGECTKHSVSGDGFPETPGLRKRRTFSFCQAIKVVVFETTLAKRVRRKPLDQDLDPSKFGTCLANSQSDSSSVHNETEEIKFDVSDPCSRSSSVGPSHPSQRENPKPENRTQESVASSETEDSSEHGGDGSSFNNIVICLILISLTTTILWGKLYAVAFTSICLYFMPRRLAARNDGLEQEEEISRDIGEEKDRKQRVGTGKSRNRDAFMY